MLLAYMQKEKILPNLQGNHRGKARLVMQQIITRRNQSTKSLDLYDVQNAFFYTVDEFRKEVWKTPQDPENIKDFDDIMTYHQNLEKSCA